MASGVVVAIAEMPFGHLPVGIRITGLIGADDSDVDWGKAHHSLRFFPNCLMGTLASTRFLRILLATQRHPAYIANNRCFRVQT